MSVFQQTEWESGFSNAQFPQFEINNAPNEPQAKGSEYMVIKRTHSIEIICIHAMKQRSGA